MNDIDHMIAVLQAFKEGKKIQVRCRSNDADDWVDAADNNAWNWDMFDYRVKPAEPRRIWLHCYSALWRLSNDCYNSREDAAESASSGVVQQIEFVEVVK